MSDFKSSNITNVSHYLPHKKPMLMVDIIEEINKEFVITKFKIQKNNVFLQNNLFQECGLIENAAQTCSAIVGQDFFFDSNLKEIEAVKVIGFISAIKKIEIFELPQAESILTTTANLDSSFETDDYTICSMFVEVKTNNRLLLKGSMNLFLQKIAHEKI